MNEKQLDELMMRVMDGEQSSAPEAEMFANLRKDLRGLRDDIPTPQISFDRVRHAIENATPQRKIFLPAWMWGPAALAACALMTMVWVRNSSPVAELTSARVAQQSAPKVGGDSVAHNEDSPSVIQTPDTAVAPKAVAAEPPAPKANPVSRKSHRRARLHRFAVEPTAPTYAMKAGSTPHETSETSQPIGTTEILPPGADSNGGAPVAAMNRPKETPQPAVTVVISGHPAASGAQAASEVEVSSDGVVGG
ncbi:MAG: hypothetical protein JST40_08860 [Armatimonadetes bacterium]|nr:hypothetical protein [Armatimonadota bacterium]